MEALTPPSLGDLHLEACASAIRGFCRLEGITQEYFARAAGITPVELSYILHRRRSPGAKFIHGLERSARLPVDLKERLLDDLFAAQCYRQQEDQEIVFRVSCQPLAELLVGIEQQYALAGKGQLGVEESRRAHQRLYHECLALTSRLGYARQDPLAFIRLCAVQAEIGCVLDRLYDSLFIAFLGERIAQSVSGPDPRSAVNEFHSPQTQIIRVKGVVYHNLHLYREAYDQILQAEETPVVKGQPDVWLPHTVRDKLKAMAHVPRFSLAAAEEYAGWGWDACQSPACDSGAAQVLSLLIDLSLVDCYLSYGSPSSLLKASRLLDRHRRRVEANAIPELAPLHRVMFYRALAEVERQARQDAASGNGALASALRTALSTAARAGLSNQLHTIARGFGPLALRLAREEGIELAPSP